MISNMCSVSSIKFGEISTMKRVNRLFENKLLRLDWYRIFIDCRLIQLEEGAHRFWLDSKNPSIFLWSLRDQRVASIHPSTYLRREIPDFVSSDWRWWLSVFCHRVRNSSNPAIVWWEWWKGDFPVSYIDLGFLPFREHLNLLHEWKASSK